MTDHTDGVWKSGVDSYSMDELLYNLDDIPSSVKHRLTWLFLWTDHIKNNQVNLYCWKTKLS